MRRSVECTLLLVLAGVLVFSGGALNAATLKPGGANSHTIYPPGGPVTDGPGFVANPRIRDLRTDFVRTWHVFADTANDAILDPGDTRVAEFKNWWTPASAATQHAYVIGTPPAAGPEYPSTPIDHQSVFTTNPLLLLPQKAGTIGFYLTYSHMDNADFDKELWSDGVSPHDTFNQRNRERNGYAMGWLTGETVKDAAGNVQLGANTGDVKMDIFIHNGKSDNDAAGAGRDDNHSFGTNVSGQDVWYNGVKTVPAGAAYSTVSRSEPQVVQSNEMNVMARQDNNLMLVADYRDDFAINPGDPKGYTYGANDGYVYAGFNGGKYLVDGDLTPATPATLATQVEFDTVIASMDVREVNAYETGLGAGDDLGGFNPIHAADTPQALLDAGVTDGLGNLYFYEDAMISRDGDTNNGSPWVEGSTDGGVIAGLSGYDEYDDYYPEGATPDPSKLLTHWGEQQVIRIDIDKATLNMLGQNGIKEIIFYDWGMPDPATGQQSNPTAITISVDANQNLYFDKDGSGDLTAADILFPDNRIYIAQVENIPEPATMLLLAVGASAMLVRRRVRRRVR